MAKLPPEVRAQVEAWLKDFLAERLSISDVAIRVEGLVAMAGLAPDHAPSRSSLHRYAQRFEKVVERIERSRQLTDMLAEQLGPAVADGRGVQVMIQAVQSLAYDLLASLEEGTAVDPKAIHDLAKATHHLASAQKTDADRALKIAEDERRKVAAEVGKLGKKLGWSAETAQTVREQILGVKLAPPKIEEAATG